MMSKTQTPLSPLKDWVCSFWISDPSHGPSRPSLFPILIVQSSPGSGHFRARRLFLTWPPWPAVMPSPWVLSLPQDTQTQAQCLYLSLWCAILSESWQASSSALQAISPVSCFWVMTVFFFQSGKICLSFSWVKEMILISLFHHCSFMALFFFNPSEHLSLFL